MRSNIQDALLSALESILRPTVKLLLQCGIGYSEFAAVAKSVFIQVATDDYKRRGRPANFSQVSAMTGISRKEVSRIRNAETDVRWTPNMETSPVNTVLHQWHFDEDFSDGAGTPKPLLFEGPLSFSTLVARYISDIPPGAMRSILEKAQVVTQDGEGRLLVSKAFANSTTFNEDFIRGLAFSWGNLGSTLVHNATLHQRTDLSDDQKNDLYRFEAGVWTEHVSKEGSQRFKEWVRKAALDYLDKANHVVGETELPQSEWANARPRAIGVGLYYYEED
jgi:hypothetical protein